MISNNDILFGPYTRGEDTPFVAYVVRLDGPERTHFVCLVVHTEDHKILLDNMTEFLNLTLNYAADKLEDWKKVPCFVATLQPGGKELMVKTYSGQETDPAGIAQSVLDASTECFEREVSGKRYLISEYAQDPKSELRTYWIQPKGGNIGFSLLARDRSHVDMLLAMRGDLDNLEAGQCWLEAITSAKEPLLGFRSYYYAVLLGKNLEKVPLIEAGKYVANELLKAGFYDYADWVASNTADLAENEDLHEDAAYALRLAGIAASMLGRFEETNGYLARAVQHLDHVSDTLLKKNVHMSFGLALIDLFAHLESELRYTGGEYDKYVQETIGTAKRHLEIARELVGTPSDEKSRESLCAIELDLFRVRDLSGDREGALAALDELIGSDRFVGTNKLILTALLYRMAILKKLAVENPGSRARYIDHIEDAERELSDLKNKSGDRFCCFCSLLGDALLEEGRVVDALRSLGLAYAMQRVRQGNNVRPPGPGITYGGLSAIDLAGKLQIGYLTLANATRDASHAWSALQVADEAKGRFFRRDLAFAVEEPKSKVSAYLASRHADLRDLLVKGGADPRILMADYEWFLERDLDPKQAEVLRDRCRFDLGVDRDEVASLLEKNSGRTALLSLYASEQETFAYLVTGPAQPLDVSVFVINLEWLRKIVRSLHIGIAGSTRYPHGINPKHPELQERFFRPFLDLQHDFASLASRLQGFDRIVISPHGIWHSLPLHVLLLPVLWEHGARPGIVYSPSIHALNLLQQRVATGEATAMRYTGLATVPASDDDAMLFTQAHSDLKAVFKLAKRPLLDAFGAMVTVESVLLDMRRVGVQHLLAHGRYEHDRNAMNSGLLLAKESDLPSKKLLRPGEDVSGHLLSGTALMASGTRAGHVTVQACSLGRAQSTLGDELWGVTRALVAGGANSVLAPLWDIDLASSTWLACRFYENWLVKGQPKWTALAEAQRRLASGEVHPEWAHFYHWAAFQLVGC